MGLDDLKYCQSWQNLLYKGNRNKKLQFSIKSIFRDSPYYLLRKVIVGLEILKKHMIKFIYCDDEIYVLIDDVASKLGFFVNNNNVRWNRMNNHLNSIGYLEKVHSNSYIPLNVFYKLTFMTNTKQAKELKNEIADIISTYV